MKNETSSRQLLTIQLFRWVSNSKFIQLKKFRDFVCSKCSDFFFIFFSFLSFFSPAANVVSRDRVYNFARRYSEAREHRRFIYQIVINAIRYLETGGRFIVTRTIHPLSRFLSAPVAYGFVSFSFTGENDRAHHLHHPLSLSHSLSLSLSAH